MDAAGSYLEQEIATNHPIKNAVLIYKNTIAKLRLVDRLFKDYKFKEADEHLDKLESLYFEMKGCVTDTDIADSLHDLYNFVITEIKMTRIVRNGDRIPGIEAVLKDLIFAYSEILKNGTEKRG